jgi:hypothetical protein
MAMLFTLLALQMRYGLADYACLVILPMRTRLSRTEWNYMPTCHPPY